jgi:hypothetical protein
MGGEQKGRTREEGCRGIRPVPPAIGPVDAPAGDRAGRDLPPVIELVEISRQ